MLIVHAPLLLGGCWLVNRLGYKIEKDPNKRYFFSDNCGWLPQVEVQTQIDF